MHLPAIREKISQLPRPHKFLFLVFLILILIVTVEASYYFSIAKKKSYESLFLDETTYQEGPFLYSRAEKERGPGAIIGRVKKIDGLVLTIESNNQEALVEMAKDFEFAELTEPGQGVFTNQMPPDSLEPLSDEVKKLRDSIIENSLSGGGLVMPERPEIDNLDNIIDVGDFIKIDLVFGEEPGGIKGRILSVLKF